MKGIGGQRDVRAMVERVARAESGTLGPRVGLHHRRRKGSKVGYADGKDVGGKGVRGAPLAPPAGYWAEPQ